MTTTSQTIDALGALAQEHRLAVFRALVQIGKGGMAAGQIAAQLNIPASSLSFHLAHLVRAGLVQQQRQGRLQIYAADYGAMHALIEFLTENCCGGEDCVADDGIDETKAGTAERLIATGGIQ